jgi:hypothetical protein
MIDWEVRLIAAEFHWTFENSLETMRSIETWEECMELSIFPESNIWWENYDGEPGKIRETASPLMISI